MRSAAGQARAWECFGTIHIGSKGAPILALLLGMRGQPRASVGERRKFIALLGATAVWPLVPRAQQSATAVIGYLGPALDTRQHWIAAFRRGLRAEGFVEGQNVRIDYRSADDATKLPELAAHLVRRQVAVIFASGPPAALAAKRATTSVPIVSLSGGDPMKMGLVSSFPRPGGNVTRDRGLSCPPPLSKIRRRQTDADRPRVGQCTNSRNYLRTARIRA